MRRFMGRVVTRELWLVDLNAYKTATYTQSGRDVTPSSTGAVNSCFGADFWPNRGEMRMASGRDVTP
jgi:hypothetical protein